jgi:hypothetical protein
MAIVNLKSYRLAKEFSKDAKDIMKVLDLTEKALAHFSHYKPVKAILSELRNQKGILSAHQATAEKILEQKEVEK